MKEKIIGILGGMGPEATRDLFANIIQFTPFKKDQDHLHIIIKSMKICCARMGYS